MSDPTREPETRRYDLVTNFRAGASIEEMEPSDDGEWVRWDTYLELHDRLKLEHDAWGRNRIAELQKVRSDLALAREGRAAAEQGITPRSTAVSAREDSQCLDCGGSLSIDVLLPRAQWLAIHPNDHGVLCGGCIVQRASAVPGARVIHLVIEFPHG